MCFFCKSRTCQFLHGVTENCLNAEGCVDTLGWLVAGDKPSDSDKDEAKITFSDSRQMDDVTYGHMGQTVFGHVEDQIYKHHGDEAHKSIIEATHRRVVEETKKHKY